jgi:aminoglycoside 3-N-acetyltransferase
MGFDKKVIYFTRIWARRFLPENILLAIRKPFRLLRARKRAANREETSPLLLSDLISNLKDAGIGPGDIVMVHSSLSRIGNVSGGAETVVKSFLDVVTLDGTVIMPAYNSAETFIRDLKHDKLLDLRVSLSGTGKITEAFRTWRGVVRSSHPFSSSCAWGKHAEYVTSGHASASFVCHADSPVGRLVKLKGKVIGLGIPIAQGLGVAHFMEDTWDGFPFEVHIGPIPVSYIDPSGKTVNRDIYRFDPVVARTRIDHPDGEWICEKLTAHLLRIGILKQFRYGQAESWLMDLVELFNELKRLAAKGVTMYLTEDKLTDQNREIDKW